MPEELAMQLPYLKQVLSAMNIPQYDLTGYEADDLIGTISRRCEAAGWDCVISHRQIRTAPAHHPPHQW